MKKKIMILTIILVGCIFIGGCGKKEDEGVDKRINLSAPDNIKVETFYSVDNSNIIVRMTNNGNEDIKDLDVYVTYPETTDDLLDEDEIFLKNFRAHSTTYASLMLPVDENFNFYIPSKINLEIKTDGENLEGIADTSNMVDLVKATYDVEDNIIDFNITNNTNKILGSVSCILVYMKDGKPIAADYIDALDVEEKYNVKRGVLYSGEDENPKYIDYDNIEVYITSITDDYVETNDDEYDDTQNDLIDEEPIEEDDDMSWD